VDDTFEERILQIKSRVGPKKRGARKKKASGASSASASAVMMPPVPLREPWSALGAPVEFVFTTYSERLNGVLVHLSIHLSISPHLVVVAAESPPLRRGRRRPEGDGARPQAR
jgi:hypothetical protein